MRRIAWTFFGLVVGLTVGCSKAERDSRGPRESSPPSHGSQSSTPASPSRTPASPAPTSSDAAQTEAARPIEHVVLISVDGLGGRYLDKLVPTGKLPTFQKLQPLGAWTHNARADFGHTGTLPNHTCMFTGRPVTTGDCLPETAPHGYDQNTDPDPADTLHNQGNPKLDYVPSVFDVVHDAGKKTCLYSGKSKFVLFQHSYDNQHGAADQTGVDNGRNKLDVVLIDARTDHLVSALVQEMHTSPCDFAFLLIADTDWAGHREGWGSGAWNTVVQRADGFIGTVWSALQSDEKLKDHTALIVLADHGGSGRSHGDVEEPLVYTIPFYVAGPGVPQNQDLYAAVSDTRHDPGDTRPPYSASPPPIRGGDAGNLALELLGLPYIPGSVFNEMHLVD